MLFLGNLDTDCKLLFCQKRSEVALGLCTFSIIILGFNRRFFFSCSRLLGHNSVLQFQKIWRPVESPVLLPGCCGPIKPSTFTLHDRKRTLHSHRSPESVNRRRCLAMTRLMVMASLPWKIGERGAPENRSPHRVPLQS